MIKRKQKCRLRVLPRPETVEVKIHYCTPQPITLQGYKLQRTLSKPETPHHQVQSEHVQHGKPSLINSPYPKSKQWCLESVALDDPLCPRIHSHIHSIRHAQHATTTQFQITRRRSNRYKLNIQRPRDNQTIRAPHHQFFSTHSP